MSQFFRVCAAALALSSLSFAAGVAGDLSDPPPVSGTTVVLRIPPPLPLDTPRAGPLPPLRTASAAARPVQVQPEPVIERAANIEVIAFTDAALAADHELIHSAPDRPFASLNKAEPVKLG